MSGYFCVTMSAMCSQAFFSTSEPDHMNQFRVTLPSLDSEDPELSPLQPAASTVAMAMATIEVRRDIRMPLLPEGRLPTPIMTIGGEDEAKKRRRRSAARAFVATSPEGWRASASPARLSPCRECVRSDIRCL